MLNSYLFLHGGHDTQYLSSTLLFFYFYHLNLTILCRRLLLLLGIEYAWNVFPSTPTSSLILGFANAAMLVGIWLGYPEGKDIGMASEKSREYLSASKSVSSMT